MRKIELVIWEDSLRMGHLVCRICGAELGVKLSGYEYFANPNCKKEWSLVHSEFSEIRVIFPQLLKCIWKKRFKSKCPSCSNNGKGEDYKIIPGSLFDLLAIKNSFKKNKVYKCTRCEKVYADERCISYSKDGYVCGDCIIYL